VNCLPLLSAQFPVVFNLVNSSIVMAVACSFKRDGGGQGEVDGCRNSAMNVNADRSTGQARPRRAGRGGNSAMNANSNRISAHYLPC
jgi:hypothetical protein